MGGAHPLGACADAVAILDDGPAWTPIAHYLAASDYAVRRAPDEAGLELVLSDERIDVVLLDVQPPRGDRFTYCQQLSRQYAASILVVGSSSDVADKVVALELGADDYIEAPCNPRELLARIRSVARGRAASRRRAPPLRQVLRFGAWSLDVIRQQVTTPQGVVVALSPGEFSLLRVFVSTSPRIVPRRELIAALAADPARPQDRAVDVLMSRLRRKLSGADEVLFRTVRNQGYLLMADVAETY